MTYSISEILGPIMIGPSSSHTAGAAKLGLVASKINNQDFSKVVFYLHGSFAMTYKGHGTDKALVGGVLGLQPDDIKIRDAFDLAKKKGIAYEFVKKEFDGMHENTVGMAFYNKDGSSRTIVGSSLGGGAIMIKRIDDAEVNFKGELPTLIIDHFDKKGVVSVLTAVLASEGINIATMQVSRKVKNKDASIIIELDDPIDPCVLEMIKSMHHINHVEYFYCK